MQITDPDIPQAYKQGWIEFCDLKFAVTPDVLIPRPETEALVEEIVKFSPSTVVDVGTGSGCIAISVAKKLPHVKITAIDISDKALNVAKQNARFHKVENQITFLQNNLLESFREKTEVIVANLPYIPSAKITLLDRSVKDFEPHLALDGGVDGLELYQKMFEQIHANDIQPNMIVIEIDDFQKDKVIEMAQKYFPKQNATILKDFSNFNRLLIIKK